MPCRVTRYWKEESHDKFEPRPFDRFSDNRLVCPWGEHRSLRRAPEERRHNLHLLWQLQTDTLSSGQEVRWNLLVSPISAARDS
jgi:hypothetical protein